MADPLIDEHIIIDLIETEISLDGAERLMAGASLLLIDAYDRKTTRDNFAQIAHVALALHSYVSQYATTTKTQRRLLEGKLDAAMIQDAVNRAAKLVEQYATVAARQAHMLKECPLSTDKVH